MRGGRIAVAALLLAFGAGAVQAQERVSLELRGGAAIPTADLGDAALNPGAGIGFNLAVRFLPHMHAYGGWDWVRLTTDEPFAGSDFDVENTGYAFGLQFRHPMFRNVSGWLRAGGLYKHIELENDALTDAIDSGHELGWEAGGGLSIPLTDRLAVTPGLRYRTFSADVEVNNVSIPVDMSWLGIEIGLNYTLGTRTFSALRR